jgi:hypothetical protein
VISRKRIVVWTSIAATLLLIGLVQRSQAADDTSRFFGTWVASVAVNGQTVTLVSVHNASGYTNTWWSPSASTPAGSGGFSAADGKYQTTAPWPNNLGTYSFTDNDTVVCTNAAGQTVTWRRQKGAVTKPKPMPMPSPPGIKR